MGDFRQGGRGGFGGRPSGSRFGGNRGSGRSFGGRSEGRSFEKHDAVCSKCGKDCQVPFRPTGSKPVYCSDCFSKNEGSDSFVSRSNNTSAQSGISSEQFTQLNAKLDKILLVLQELEIATDDEDLEEIDEEDGDEGDSDNGK